MKNSKTTIGMLSFIFVLSIIAYPALSSAHGGGEDASSQSSEIIADTHSNSTMGGMGMMHNRMKGMHNEDGSMEGIGMMKNMHSENGFMHSFMSKWFGNNDDIDSQELKAQRKEFLENQLELLEQED